MLNYVETIWNIQQSWEWGNSWDDNSLLSDMIVDYYGSFPTKYRLVMIKGAIK